MCDEEEARVPPLTLRVYVRNVKSLKMTPRVDLNPPPPRDDLNPPPPCVDLNLPPPPDENHDQAAEEQMQSGTELLVPQIIDVDLIDDDDDVVISSAQEFAEATKNFRTKRRKIVIDLDSGEETLPGQDFSVQTVKNYYQHLKLNKEKPKPKPKPKPVFSCPVCMDSLKNEMSTKCGHIFCKKCIQKAITVQGKCPTCRRKITMKDTLKVYLPSVN